MKKLTTYFIILYLIFSFCAWDLMWAINIKHAMTIRIIFIVLFIAISGSSNEKDKYDDGDTLCDY